MLNRSDFPERTGKHFISYCNQQLPGSSDYNIAHAVFHHVGNLLNLSLESLASESHLSKASISRFFHRCGFETFSDFKNQLQTFLFLRSRQKLQKQLTAYHGKSNEAIIRQLYGTAMQNMSETVENMNFTNLRLVLEQLRRAKTIYIIGDTRDIYCFYSLQMDLMCIGKEVYLYNIDNISPSTIPQLDEHTAIVLLSVNPAWYYEEMVLLSRAAKAKGAYRILFSQGEPQEKIGHELCYIYGQPGSTNEGYHSLILLAQMLSVLFYQTDLPDRSDSSGTSWYPTDRIP